MTYVLSQIAERDIDEIVTYIAEENPKAAYNFIDTLYETFGKLTENPFMGHLREDLTDHQIEELHEPAIQPSKSLIGTQSALSKEELEILIFCQKPQFMHAIRAKLGWKDRTKFRRRFIDPLLKQELLARTIPDKLHSRLQQYQTTANGLPLLNA